MALVLLILGIGIGVVGALFKIQHWPYASALLITSSSLEVIALLVLAVKVWDHPGFKDFLDR